MRKFFLFILFIGMLGCSNKSTNKKLKEDIKLFAKEGFSFGLLYVKNTLKEGDRNVLISYNVAMNVLDEHPEYLDDVRPKNKYTDKIKKDADSLFKIAYIISNVSSAGFMSLIIDEFIENDKELSTEETQFLIDILDKYNTSLSTFYADYFDKNVTEDLIKKYKDSYDMKKYFTEILLDKKHFKTFYTEFLDSIEVYGKRYYNNE